MDVCDVRISYSHNSVGAIFVRVEIIFWTLYAGCIKTIAQNVLSTYVY